VKAAILISDQGLLISGAAHDHVDTASIAALVIDTVATAQRFGLQLEAGRDAEHGRNKAATQINPDLKRRSGISKSQRTGKGHQKGLQGLPIPGEIRTTISTV